MYGVGIDNLYNVRLSPNLHTPFVIKWNLQV
jgi:hypothetical protein